jgi:hypothetical protein
LKKKAALEFNKVIALIIGVFALMVIVTYLLIAKGGPKDLIIKILGVMNSSTENVIKTVN